jgi:hypothetical protein
MDEAELEALKARVHKATPSDENAPLTSCTICKELVRPVPGGQGRTWVHDATGAVAGPTPTG